MRIISCKICNYSAILLRIISCKICNYSAILGCYNLNDLEQYLKILIPKYLNFVFNDLFGIKHLCAALFSPAMICVIQRYIYNDRYEECLFSLPEKAKKGVLQPGETSAAVTAPPPEHLRVSVHYSPKEEMIAMATIDMEDLLSLVGTCS